MQVVQQATHSYPLSMAGEGERVKIVMLKGGKGLDKRLTSLGLNVDSELLVLQRQGASLVLARSEARFALGAGMAQKIMVCSVAD
ncbi:MAG: FeoA domain-containing protein [Pseudomonadota bacterium]